MWYDGTWVAREGQLACVGNSGDERDRQTDGCVLSIQRTRTAHHHTLYYIVLFVV